MTDKAEDRNGTTSRPPWATGASKGFPGTSTFTPPSATKVIAPPSEPRLPKGFPQTGLPKTGLPKPQGQAKNPQSEPRKTRRIGTVLLSALVVILVVAAGLLAWKAFSLSGTESVAAPVPPKEFVQPAGDKSFGPTGIEPVAVTNSEGIGTMTAAEMGPNTLFIPALGVYMPVEAATAFVASQYAGFDTIKIPNDASHGVWYTGGAPMYGSQNGTTLIASHVSTATGWGVLRYLYTLTGGEMIHTKDATGQLQSWQLKQMRVENHTAFPQEYWSPEGERRLVVTTCGGQLANGIFTKNIFAVAVPVDPEPKPATQDEVKQDHQDMTAAAGKAANVTLGPGSSRIVGDKSHVFG